MDPGKDAIRFGVYADSNKTFEKDFQTSGGDDEKADVHIAFEDRPRFRHLGHRKNVSRFGWASPSVLAQHKGTVQRGGSRATLQRVSLAGMSGNLAGGVLFIDDSGEERFKHIEEPLGAIPDMAKLTEAVGWGGLGVDLVYAEKKT